MTAAQKAENQRRMVHRDLLDAASMLTRLAEAIERGDRCADKIGNVACNLVRAVTLCAEAEGMLAGMPADRSEG